MQDRIEVSVNVRTGQPRDGWFVVDVTTSSEMSHDWFREMEAQVPDIAIHDVEQCRFSFTAPLDEVVSTFRRILAATHYANAKHGP